MITADLAPWRCLAVVNSNCLLAVGGYRDHIQQIQAGAWHHLPCGFVCLFINLSCPRIKRQALQENGSSFLKFKEVGIAVIHCWYINLIHSGIFRYLSWLYWFNMLWYMCQPIHCFLKALYQCEILLVLKSRSYQYSLLLLHKWCHCPQEKQYPGKVFKFRAEGFLFLCIIHKENNSRKEIICKLELN